MSEGLAAQLQPSQHRPECGRHRDGMDNETGTESLVSHRQRARRRNREEGTAGALDPWDLRAPQALAGPPSSGSLVEVPDPNTLDPSDPSAALQSPTAPR